MFLTIGQEQFNVNLQWHSQFMLFSYKTPTTEQILQNPEAQFWPYQMKLKTNDLDLTIEERTLIEGLRKWVKTGYRMPDKMCEPSMNVVESKKTCDLHVKVLEIRAENDMFYEICFSDHSGFKLFLKVSQNIFKQWDIQEGDIVRVRSIKFAKGTSNYIELSNQSHVLKFPPESDIYKDIDNRLKDDMTISMMMATPSDNVILDHPITVSKTSERYNSVELKTLYELFHDQDSPSY